MIYATTPTIQGANILQYHGVVTGEAAIGGHVLESFFAAIHDAPKQRTTAYERERSEARAKAFQALNQKAEAAGANAIIAISIDYETLDDQNAMSVVSISGAAVTVELENAA